MQITRSSLDTNPGPSDWFTGSVYIDAIAAPSDGSQVGAANVHFAPGARTAWHTHPHGQTIWVTEGVGFFVQRDLLVVERAVRFRHGPRRAALPRRPVRARLQRRRQPAAQRRATVTF